MVQILVNVEKNTKEWFIVEVQGDLECDSGSSVAGSTIGELLFLSKERPILIIGYHILYGKIVEINPGIAVLQKHKDSNVKLTSDSLPTKKSTSYSLLALVKKTIVFRTRPKPIITPEE